MGEFQGWFKPFGLDPDLDEPVLSQLMPKGVSNGLITAEVELLIRPPTRLKNPVVGRLGVSAIDRHAQRFEAIGSKDAGLPIHANESSRTVKRYESNRIHGSNRSLASQRGDDPKHEGGQNGNQDHRRDWNENGETILLISDVSWQPADSKPRHALRKPDQPADRRNSEAKNEDASADLIHPQILSDRDRWVAETDLIRPNTVNLPNPAMKIQLPIAIFLAAAVSFAAGNQGLRLMRTPKVGQETRLRLKAEIDLLGTSALFTALVIEKVTAVDAQGNYTIESRQTEAKTLYGTQETKVADSGARSATYRPTGEIKEIKVGSPGGVDVRLARLGGFVVPDRELKVGESWSHIYPADSSSALVGGKADYKLAKTEKIDHRTVAIVEMTYKESSGAAPAEANGKAWIELETGEVVRLESDWKNAPFMGPDVPLNAKVTLVKA